MSKYVNVEDALNLQIDDNTGDPFALGWNRAIAKVATDLPTEDVAPVIHAHWKEKGVWVPLARDASPWSYDEDRYDFETHSQKEFWWVCSNCDYKGDDCIKPEWINYCPKCGAKMDEKEQ